MPRTPTKLTVYLRALKDRIAAYNQQIREELKRPLPDWLRMRELKAAKLKAKDQIARTLSKASTTGRTGEVRAV